MLLKVHIKRRVSSGSSIQDFERYLVKSEPGAFDKLLNASRIAELVELYERAPFLVNVRRELSSKASMTGFTGTGVVVARWPKVVLPSFDGSRMSRKLLS